MIHNVTQSFQENRPCSLFSYRRGYPLVLVALVCVIGLAFGMVPGTPAARAATHIQQSPLSSNPTTPAVATARNKDGRLEIFAITSDGTLHHIWQTNLTGGWSHWESLGGTLDITFFPVAMLNVDGRLEVFALTTSGVTDHIRQLNPGGTTGWSTWGALNGRFIGTPAIVQNKDGRLEVFAADSFDKTLDHVWQLSPGGAWSNVASLGGNLVSAPAVARNADGRLEVFTMEQGGTSTHILKHIWQLSPGGAWSNWAAFGGNLASPPVVGLNQDGRLEVFFLDGGKTLQHVWQLHPGGSGGWSNVAALPGGNLASLPAVGLNQDGRLEVFALANDGTLQHMWQLSPGIGWSNWASLGGF